jgi:TonB family protein
MDASTRSYHVYGKTPAGVEVLATARGTLPSSARQLLILIDGNRTAGDLSQIFGPEPFNRSLEVLEARGYVQIVRRFPDAEPLIENARAPAPKTQAVPAAPAARAPAAPAPQSPATAPKTQAAPSAPAAGVSAAAAPQTHVPARRRVPAPLVLLAALAALAGPLAYQRASLTQVLALLAPLAETLAPTSAPVSEPPGAQDPAQPAPKPAARAPSRAGLPAARAAAAPSTEATASAPRASELRLAPATAAAADARPAPATPAGVDAHAPAAPAPTRELHVRYQVMPKLPSRAQELGIKSGHAVVLLHVTAQGAVELVELVSATPPQIYDDEMKEAFEQWTFEPPGVPGRMTVEVDLTGPPP